MSGERSGFVKGRGRMMVLEKRRGGSGRGSRPIRKVELLADSSWKNGRRALKEKGRKKGRWSRAAKKTTEAEKKKKTPIKKETTKGSPPAGERGRGNAASSSRGKERNGSRSAAAPTGNEQTSSAT